MRNLLAYPLPILGSLYTQFATTAGGWRLMRQSKDTAEARARNTNAVTIDRLTRLTSLLYYFYHSNIHFSRYWNIGKDMYFRARNITIK